MVRKVTVTLPTDQASKFRDILHKQRIVHDLIVFHGENNKSQLVFKCANKKTNEITELLLMWGVTISFGRIDIAVSEKQTHNFFFRFFFSFFRFSLT